MDFGLAITGNIPQEKIDMIVGLSDKLGVFFRNKNYGTSIKSYTIGIVCVAPQFDAFFKGKKPQYTKGKKIINPDGIPFTLEDNFEYSIKLNYGDFIKSTIDEGLKMLAENLIASLTLLDSFRKKLDDFDVEKFKVDLENYFSSQDLL